MPNLPSGTITFLFTDIEGSTHLWERQPDAMKAALACHDALMRQAIEAHGGHVFKTMGDAFCAAFASAPEALAAALAAQRALHVEKWASEIGMLQVRMALHTGTAEERGGDYFGPPLNRVARLLAAGHGGQTLLSLATQELVRDALPAKASLLDLGEHRLKDLFRPERVYQLVVPDLPAEFPPLRTLDTRQTNLPAQPTPFVGREREVAAVLGLLRDPSVRLATLTGAGGTGKTRLALQAAADLVDEYEHGVFFVALASLTDQALVIPTIASTLRVRETGDQPLAEVLNDYLHERQMLLVLDNFEQIMKAASSLGELLAAAPRLKLMVTSREVLRVYGEHDYPVPPLGLPDLKRRQTVAVLSQYEAVALFIQRAKAAKPDFEITEENAPAVAEICVRLDGLPLAIELAAARSRMLAPPAMLERLSSRLKTLTGGARDLPARQQTLRGAIDWSYDLLSESEKTLFTRLGVFVGGWMPEAAEQICSGSGAQNLAPLPIDVLNGLESLLDKSLIRQADGAGGETRFTMLETIREYAAERLDRCDEAGAIHGLHAGFYTALAEQAEPALEGAEVAVWLNRLGDERDNIRAVMGWALPRREAETALKIGAALWRSCDFHNNRDEVRGWLTQALALPGNVPIPLRARALRAAGNLSFDTDPAAARPLYEESITLSRTLGDQQEIAACLNNLGNIACMQKDYAAARAFYEDGLALDVELGNRFNQGIVQHNLGNLAEKQGDYAEARSRYEKNLALRREDGSALYAAFAIYALGQLALRLGEDDRARELLEEILPLAREVKFAAGLAYTLGVLAVVEFRAGNQDKARALLEESMRTYREIARDIGPSDSIIFPLELAVRLALADGRPEHAAVLFGSAEAFRDYFDLHRTPFERADYEPVIAALRAAMDEAAFDAASAKGRAMTMTQAVECALIADS